MGRDQASGSEREKWRGLLADIRRADTPRGRRRLGRFAIEGTRVHERALRAGAAVEGVLVSAGFRNDRSPRVRALLRELEARGCRIEIAPDPVVEELTAGRGIGAVVGLVRLPQPPSLGDVLSRRTGGYPALLVAVDVEDPGNVGALVRTALASGAAAFAAVGISDAFHPRAVRTSMGSLFKLPILPYGSTASLFAELERERLLKIAAMARGGTPLPEMRLDGRGAALFLGGEAFGLPVEVARAMDERVTVPMAEGVDSFSVNAAAAIILYEIGRRRS